jgi:peptidoglycan hydrolase CwlO-like protein
MSGDMSKVLKLYQKKEKLFADMLKYVSGKASLGLKDDMPKNVKEFTTYNNNLKVYFDVLQRIQDDIGKLGSEDCTDKEVCEIEERCKNMAKKIYDADKKINDSMVELTDKIRKQYVSVKRQIKYFNYNATAVPVADTGYSFDVRQ